MSIQRIEPTIYYDESKHLYNFPFKLEFKNGLEHSVNFYFHQEDYKDQEEMLKDRIQKVIDKIIEEPYMEVFESLQEICLEEEENINEEYVNTINEHLDILYNYYLVLLKLHIGEEQKNTLIEYYEELMEMFILLEDFYSSSRKHEFVSKKNCFLYLQKYLKI